MPFEPPRSLSPSKITAFRDCALAFRFSAIDRLPDEPTIWTVKGTFVHRVLEKLFWNTEGGQRTVERAMLELEVTFAEMRGDPDFLSLALTDEEEESFLADASGLVSNYFCLEDPSQIDAVGVEIQLEATVGTMHLRGVIDRLDRTPEGDLVVVDYKTGRAPAPAYEHAKLLGVHTYALLCEEVLGRRPVEVRLLHLREPVAISAVPTEQLVRGQRQKTKAVWTAIERACRDEDFRPRTSPLCSYCRFQPFCPAFGGDPGQAAVALGRPMDTPMVDGAGVAPADGPLGAVTPTGTSSAA